LSPLFLEDNSADCTRFRPKIGAHIVECEPKDLDIYSRIVSVCFVEGEDINAWMVAKGWALAYRQYSRDYVSQEERASKANLGMWQGEFELPWDWRQRISQSNAHLQPDDKQPTSTPSKDCAIKGNINDRGRHIYHIPGTNFTVEQLSLPRRASGAFAAKRKQ
jgi:hypothetical protein